MKRRRMITKERREKIFAALWSAREVLQGDGFDQHGVECTCSDKEDCDVCKALTQIAAALVIVR